MNTVLSLLGAYLIGSVSFGYLAGKLLKGIDIREHGSGNAGTTNIQRTVGTVPAIFVLLLDVGKGVAAVLLAGYLTGQPTVMMLAGVAAIVGHNWPVFFRFRGGRGIATSIGVLLGLAPVVILIATAIGVTLIALTRYVSLGSVVGAATIPILMLIFTKPPSYILFGAIIGGLAVWRHRENIVRLLNGTENKLGKKVPVPQEEKRVEK
ncbi:MAG: glycerol-3-phosphate 1-O-acyltransferase PlsY [Bacillota bacterium]|nr:glycerol-3-phosphate 1-O-acyltransferase PlsY [Bacillota bacterium]MDW7684135.1 glycerol-3-phosphate 1-O-acyltransferase PlsY [Bacillota bacterium]